MSNIAITGGSPQDVQSFFNRLNLESALQDIRSSDKHQPEDRKSKVQKQQQHAAIEAGLGKDGTAGAGGAAPSGAGSAAPVSISLA